MDVTLRQMLDAMVHEPDDATFRWYQTSTPSHNGMGAVAGPTFRVTMGQARKELAATPPVPDAETPACLW